MRKEDILEILSDWNLWTHDIHTGIHREHYCSTLSSLLIDTDQIICISGVRRCGKSTLIKQIVKELSKKTGKNSTLIVNFEDERFSERSLNTLRDIYECYVEQIKPSGINPFIFLDEIQNVHEWERFVRGMHERKEAKILVSGSSSKLLSTELATLLTGRHIIFTLYPLSFKEFLSFKNIHIQSEIDVATNRTDIKKLLREYLEFGGFPEIVLSPEKKRILLSYFDTIISRDIIERFRIREREKIRTLAKFYLTNISSPITFNKISQFLTLPLTSIERFSGHLETAHLLFYVKRFSYSFKEQEKSPRKVYSIDCGLSNVIGFRFTENLEKLMENVVAIELKRRQTTYPDLELYYWKDYQQREVDFVLKKGTQITQLIQVTADIQDMNTKQRELRSLLRAMKEFTLDEGLIITEDVDDEEEIDGKKIIYKSLWRWLLE